MRPNIRTSSLFRMVYLRLLHRYRLHCKVMIPILMIGGTVFYATTWVLRAA